MSAGASGVAVETTGSGTTVRLERTGFAGPARTVLLFAMAMPWLIVGPIFVLWVGGTLPAWAMVAGAVLSAGIGFALSLVAFVLASRTHHIEVDADEVRFWTDAPVGAVSRTWERGVVEGFVCREAREGGGWVLEIVATSGDRLVLPLSRPAEELRAFASAANRAMAGDEEDPEAPVAPAGR